LYDLERLSYHPFASDALSCNENGLVTWLLNEPADNPDSSSNAGDAEDAENGGTEGGEGAGDTEGDA
jgi:hypothetical protein